MDENRRIDEWGRVIVNPDAAFKLALEGHDIWSMPFDAGPELTRYNEFCFRFDKEEVSLSLPTPPDRSPEEQHALNARSWLVADDIKVIEVRSFLLDLCKTQQERDRVNMEMDLYEQRDLIPLLQLMLYLVDHFRSQNVVWGVGRGSSVASYVLYLIGVHKIDSMRYGLDVREFLK